MSRDKRYDPEDLETLLSTKPFSELLPEEKAFVLQYIDSDLEYDSMRETYATLGTLPELESEITPRASTREALLSAFAQENDKVAPVIVPDEKKKNGFLAWFWNTEKSPFTRPALQLASLVVVFMAGFFILTNNSGPDLAESTHKSDVSENTEEPADRITNDNSRKNITKQIAKDKVDNSIEKTKELLQTESDNKDQVEHFITVEATNNNGSFNPEVANELAELDITLKDLEITSGKSEYQTDQANFTFNDTSTSELNKKEVIDSNLGYLESDLLEMTEEESIAQEQKSLTDSQELDSSLIILLGDEAIASDYRTTAGNAVVVPTSAETVTDIDSPLAMLELDEDMTSESAVTANAFNGLLGKLYTSK